MFGLLAKCSLHLLRLASNALFCFEFNRLLGRASRGTVSHRRRQLPRIAASLISRIAAPVRTVDITVPSSSSCSAAPSLSIHTIIAGRAASAATSADAADDNPIVLLHGHSMGGATFYRNVDDLLHLGFTSVYMPDLPGFGCSTRIPFDGDADAAIAYFVTPMLHWLSQLNLSSQLHPRGITIAGHSLGGYIAHELAIHLSTTTTNNMTTINNTLLSLPSLNRLIMISPAAIRRPTPMVTALWFRMTPQRLLTSGGLLAHILFASKYPSSPAYNEPGMRAFAHMANSISHRTGDAAAAAILSLRAWRAECVRPLVERVRPLACEVHLVAGCRDALVPVDATRELYDALARTGNEVALSVVGQGADHSPHIVNPRGFAEAVARAGVSFEVVRRRVERLRRAGEEAK